MKETESLKLKNIKWRRQKTRVKEAAADISGSEKLGKGGRY